MLGQIGFDGKTKLDVTLERIRAFEPKNGDGYYLAFSGGKDSQCIYHLAKMAGVKFEAHYAVTSVDPPELIYFIRENYPDVIFDIPHDKDGKRISMWSLIRANGTVPTRLLRFCCRDLKERYNAPGKLVMTGVRWSESLNRRKNQGAVTIIGKNTKNLKRELDEIGANYANSEKGGLVLNMDNDENRRSVEICYRTHKTLVNPIIDWDEAEVWEFLNEIVKVPHCSLYDEGQTRIGCIGCPMGRAKGMKREFERWPKYKDLYLRTIKKTVEEHPQKYLEPPTNATNAYWYNEMMRRTGGLPDADVMTDIVFEWWTNDR